MPELENIFYTKSQSQDQNSKSSITNTLAMLSVVCVLTVKNLLTVYQITCREEWIKSTSFSNTDVNQSCKGC